MQRQNTATSLRYKNLDSSHATESIYYALCSFAKRMDHTPAPPDGLLSARVIGEFSAGKTRFLRELLSHQIPPTLFPVSSLERQTRLPLEITYGETATLELIKRANDYDAAVVIKTLTDFPQREALGDYDPLQYRLRLALPESNLFLPTGDHFGEDDQAPKRLLLIDMPGWNSGDDEIAESDATTIMTGYHNLALIFVVNANRLDGEDNHARLSDFLDTIAEADFLDTPRLIVVITHCGRDNRERLSKRMRERIMSSWTDELDQASEELDLQLLAIDFADMTQDERVVFRDTLWTHLLAPVQQQPTPSASHPWSHAIRQWTHDEDPRPHILCAAQQLNEARVLLARACIEGDFMPGMNMHRLLGLDKAAMRSRVLETWWRQLKYRDLAEVTRSFAPPAIFADDHPLSAWWNHYWRPNLERMLAPVREFLIQAENALHQMPANTPDLSAYLAEHLNDQYNHALQALDSSFTCLIESLKALPEETPIEKSVATLFKLSLLEARYMDHYTWAKHHL